MADTKQKVFGIGLHRTGTTTIRAALGVLGYDVVPAWRWTGRYSMNLDRDSVLQDALALAAAHEAGGYMPFSTFYKELYEAYPDAKFVLTERDEDKWLASMTGFFGGANWPEVRFAFGCNADPEYKNRLLSVMRQHNQDVKDFFADKPGSLLVMNIGRGDRWPALCAFLDKPVPETPFPRVNAKGSLYAHFVERAIPAIATARAFLMGEKNKKLSKPYMHK